MAVLAAGMALSAIFFGLSSSPASAHNTFLDSSPAEGEILATAPATWSISFESEVPLNSASAEIVRPDGTRTALPAPTHGASTSMVVFAMPSDLTGSVTARWRLVGTDGHVISGRVNFSIGRASSPAARATSDDNASNGLPAPAQTALRVMNYVALLALGGLLMAETFFARGNLGAPVASHTVAYSGALLAIVPAVQTLQLAADISSSSLLGAVARLGDALSVVPGQMTALRVVFGVILAAVAISVTRGHRDRNGFLVAAGAGGGYLVTLAYAGHSRSEGSAWLGIPVDVVHTAAVAYWLGGVAVLVLVIAPMLDARSAVAAYRRFGDGARIAVPVIIATGVIQTARLHGGLTTLITTAHGRVLLVKIAVVATMLKFADRNRRMLADTPQPGGDRRLRRDITVAALTETGIGLAVVALTAILVTSSLS